MASRGSSEMHWLQRSAQEADLPVDEQLAAELGGAEERATETQMHRASKTARNTDKRPDRADEMDATTEEAGSSAKGSKRRRKDKADKNIAMESADDEGIAGGPAGHGKCTAPTQLQTALPSGGATAAAT